MSSITKEALAYISGWLQYRQEQLNIPGIQFAILVNKEIVLSGAYGVADLTTGSALREDHLFHISSQSKMFTATAIFQLHQQDLLRIDDELEKFLPEITTIKEPLVGCTIRDVLSHGSGILRDGTDGTYWGLERPFPTSNALITALGSRPAAYLPNEKCKYSNSAYALLGLVIERVSGISYDKYIETNIINPLKLSNTSTIFRSRNLSKFAGLHTSLYPGGIRLPIEHLPANGMAPAVGYCSNTQDLCRFAASHFMGNEELLNDSMKRLMQHPVWEISGTNSMQSLGLKVTKLDSRTLFEHGGNWPGHYTSTCFDSANSIAVSVASNAIGPSMSEVTESIFKIVDFTLKHTNHEKSDVYSYLDKFCGRFSNLWRTFDVARFGDKLFMLELNQANPTAYPTILEPIDGQTLYIAKSHRSLPHGESVTYKFDDQTTKYIKFGSEHAWPHDVFQNRLADLSKISLPFD